MSKADLWPLRVLQSFCPEHLYEEIEGDLIQRYQRDVKRHGAVKARRKLYWSTLRFFRPGIVLRNKLSFKLNSGTMIYTYLKIAVRSLIKRRAYSFINVFGLVLGLSVCLVIWRYVQFELSYEDFHKNGSDIYRTLF